MKGEIYGRLGNDRFGLLIKKEYFNEQIFTEIPAEIMRKECDETFPMNVYVGVYEITDKRMGVDLMCDRAFMALATIKGNFHITVAYYNDAIRESALREQTLISELPEAMASGQFKLYLQPQVTAEGKVLGAEGLIRWEHPREGLIVPAEFITIFEKSGAIARLDYHVWKLACQQLKKWKERGRTDLYVSINISSKDFYFMDIYKVITELVRDYDISPANLKLEITETAIMMELPKQLEIIQKLRQEGFAVEMDDFGSGYSSLNMLKDICVDVLKIDMAFLGATNDEARGRKILKMVVELAKELGMPVITEGVEQEEQLEFLKRIGCEVFQGYYFAKPMPIHEFEEMYM